MRTMKVCTACGVPEGISRGNTWWADGTVTGKFPPYIKGAFFDVEELSGLLRHLSRVLGYDVDHLAAAGKYHDAKEYTEALLERAAEAGGRKPEVEVLYGNLAQSVRLWGIAAVEIVDVEGPVKVLKVENPYSIPLLCGDVAAVAAAAEGGEYRARWEGGDAAGLLVVEPGEAYSEQAGRVAEEIYAGEEPMVGELQVERCRRCGAPLLLSRTFRWEPEKGFIVEAGTGRRYCFNNTNGVTTVLDLLVEELGTEVEEEMVRKVREYSRRIYREHREAAAVLPSTFPVRGWGLFRREQAGEETAVTVSAPFSRRLLAGRLWGWEEARRGRELVEERETSPRGDLVLRFRPA